jgi:hypothetical protein
MFCLVVGDVGPLESPGGCICEIPMEQPFHLVLNLKTSKTLSLMIPSSMQLLADEVIE